MKILIGQKVYPDKMDHVCECLYDKVDKANQAV